MCSYFNFIHKKALDQIISWANFLLAKSFFGMQLLRKLIEKKSVSAVSISIFLNRKCMLHLSTIDPETAQLLKELYTLQKANEQFALAGGTSQKHRIGKPRFSILRC